MNNFINYNSILRELYLINHKNGVRLELQTIEALCRELGNPEQKYPAICVAGTNGKGSVVSKIHATLTRAGYKVGLYTSPHISSFRERIRINDSEISEQAVLLLLEKILSIAKEKHISATFFEYVTALAFTYFAEEKIDVAVLETGLGGRLDATNVSRSILSVITSISLDHTAILGETIEEITQEKAGIIKKHIPVVIGPKVPITSIKKIALDLQSSLICVEDEGGDKVCNFEEENRAIAKKALELLCENFSISAEAIEQGLQSLPPCRFERVAPELLIKKLGPHIPRAVVLDVGHNPDAIQRLFMRLTETFGSASFCVVYGASKDKDVRSCLELITKKAHSMYFVAAASPRAMQSVDLIEIAKTMESESELCSCASIEEGMELAFLQAAQKNQVLVVCGSFFIMHKARAFLGFDEPYDCIDLQERIVQRGDCLQK